MKTLNDYFSHIYCINLDRRPDRYTLCQEEFKKLNIDVERIAAFDGRGFPDTGMQFNKGAHGLTLTNVQILMDAIVNKYDSILILEDDVVFADDFYNKIGKKLSQLPDNWDLLYFGGKHSNNKRNLTLILSDEHSLYQVKNTVTTHAVAIKFKFYEILLNKINEDNKEPIDLIQSSLQASCNAYAFIPDLAKQRSGYSDIKNNYREYDTF